MHADELLRQFAHRMNSVIPGSPVVSPLEHPAPPLHWLDTSDWETSSRKSAPTR